MQRRGSVLIYGASGYSGRMIAERAKMLGMDAILAGRDAGRVQPLAAALGLPWRVFGLDDPARLDAGLAGVGVVLHAAGPFTSTACPMIDACLRTRTHYLDIAGELTVFQGARRLGGLAQTRGVMLMPGAAYAIAASDCLVAHLAARTPDAKYLRLALSKPEMASRGSVRTMFDLVRGGVSIRRAGELASVPVGRLERDFDFGEGLRKATAVSWADVITAHHTTGIPNIEVYAEAGPLYRTVYQANAWFAAQFGRVDERLLRPFVAAWPEGPSEAQRVSKRQVILAEMEDPWRRSTRARITTLDGYSFTPLAALALVERVLQGDAEAGFQTPAGLYGPDFILGFEGTEREDLDETWRPVMPVARAYATSPAGDGR
jgi:short subunit dehydrogenase-like uncharacterized protein